MGRGGVAVATVMGTVQVKKNSQSVQCCSQLSLKQVGPGGVTIYPPLSLSLSLSLLSTIVFKTGGTWGRGDLHPRGGRQCRKRRHCHRWGSRCRHSFCIHWWGEQIIQRKLDNQTQHQEFIKEIINWRSDYICSAVSSSISWGSGISKRIYSVTRTHFLDFLSGTNFDFHRAQFQCTNSSSTFQPRW